MLLCLKQSSKLKDASLWLFFPYQPSSLWWSGRGSCLSAGSGCCLLKRDLAMKWCEKLLGAPKAPVWERSRLYRAWWKGSWGLPLIWITPKFAAGCTSVTVTDSGYREHLLWSEVRQDTCYFTSRVWGYLTCTVILDFLFFVPLVSEDVFLRTEITVAWIRRKLLTALLFFLIAAILC